MIKDYIFYFWYFIRFVGNFKDFFLFFLLSFNLQKYPKFSKLILVKFALIKILFSLFIKFSLLPRFQKIITRHVFKRIRIYLSEYCISISLKLVINPLYTKCISSSSILKFGVHMSLTYKNFWKWKICILDIFKLKTNF